MPERGPQQEVVLLSNRGPVTFERSDAGGLEWRRGAGGLVSGLAPLVAGTGATWIAAAMSEADREAAGRGVVEADGMHVRYLDVPARTYRAYYDVICNATLWFCHHGLFDHARRPRIDRHWREAWAAYGDVNTAFASATAEAAPEGAIVLVQDYHLALVAQALAPARPDLRLVHFSHTPFAEPEWLAVLPEEAVAALLQGMAAHHACGFHTQRWADGFLRCWRRAFADVPAPVTFVAPLAADAGDLAEVAASPAGRAARARLEDLLGGRQLIVRVDRIEPSKNILRGFWAFDDLLEQHPEHRGKVVFAALLYPSREGLAEYLAYREEVQGLAERLNQKWGSHGWTPIVLDATDDFPASVAALQLADVVLVNPIRDGLNLVAKEAALLSQTAGTLVLSTQAGAWEELAGRGAIGVNPFDIAATGDALDAALRLDEDERRRRSESLRAAAAARTPKDWLADQLRA